MNRNGAEAQADRLLDRKDPGRWNQALMELGATICVPRDPKCGECPIARYCEARINGTQSEFPAKRVKPAVVRLTRTLLVIRRRGRILLTPSPRVKGFWDLPEDLEGARLGVVCDEFRHTITHRQYRFIVRPAGVEVVPRGSRWFRESELDEIALSTTAKKALLCAEKAARGPAQPGS